MVHHLALEARIGRTMLQVVVNGFDEMSDIAAKDSELVDTLLCGT